MLIELLEDEEDLCSIYLLFLILKEQLMVFEVLFFSLLAIEESWLLRLLSSDEFLGPVVVWVDRTGFLLCILLELVDVVPLEGERTILVFLVQVVHVVALFDLLLVFLLGDSSESKLLVKGFWVLDRLVVPSLHVRLLHQLILLTRLAVTFVLEGLARGPQEGVIILDGLFETLEQVLGLKVFGEDLIKGDQLASTHVLLKGSSGEESLVDYLLELILDVLAGRLSHIHEVEVFGHLRSPVLWIVGVSDADLSQLVTESSLALLDGLVSEDIEVKDGLRGSRANQVAVLFLQILLRLIVAQ